SSSLIFSRFIGSSAPAACCRAPASSCKIVEQVFPCSVARSIWWRPAGCRSTLIIRRWRCSRTGASWLTAPWAATANRKPKPQCSHAMSHSACRSMRQSIDRAGSWAASDEHARLRLEPRFDGNLVDRLLAAGHDVELVYAGAVVLHPDGTCEGVHDPRADGGAAGM